MIELEVELELEQVYISLFLISSLSFRFPQINAKHSLKTSAFQHHCLFFFACKILRRQCSLVFALLSHHSTTSGVDEYRVGFSVDSILTNIIYFICAVWADSGEEYLGC